MTDIGSKERPLELNDPLSVARAMQEACFGGPMNLRFWQGLWWLWSGGKWVRREQRWLENQAWAWLENVYVGTGKECRRVTPSIHRVAEVVRAMEADVTMEVEQLPVWLDPQGKPDPGGCVAFEDVVVEVATGKTWERGPEWFGVGVVPAKYDPEAKCPVWEGCIEQWGCGDPGWGRLLQAITGYLMVSDRRYARWPLLYGVPRAGKGLICRTWQRLMPQAVDSTDLETMAAPFGLAGKEGVRVLIVNEASNLRGNEGEKAARVLKNLVGGDPVPARQLYQRVQTAKVLPMVPVLCSNPVPRLPNHGEGLAMKCLPLRFLRSWKGKENFYLEEEVAKELAGVAVWGLEGARKLKEGWPETQEGGAVVKTFNLLNNPLDAFLEARFVRDEEGFVPHGLVWREWCSFREATKTATTVSKNMIGVVLEQETTWGLRRGQQKASGSRGLYGLRLRKKIDDVA